MFATPDLLGILLLWLLGARNRQERGGGGYAPPPQLPPATGVQTSWPQAVPAGLPAFPGSGWQYDEPPPAAVVRRAGELVQLLWNEGKGAFRVEQTGGRWIAYRAEVMRSGKKGVAAYRQKKSSPAATAARAPAAAPRAPATAAAPAPAPAAPAAQPVRLPPDSRVLPTLRRGIGIKPQQPNEDVKLMQRRLKINADGQFGGGTEAALKHFQGLQVIAGRKGWGPEDIDGVCGPKTWTALLEVKA